ncbi:hypothetical protein B0T20DRAFT_401102 [Sordaria brevicollis]|uniref:FCP1 homology domain-containing protein n=1 Tax=Sordaria brevicollis TaxID=83679 RepID=A0AAE0PP22_SORBR|nr:hypothetical protein B0T20DRAFT_401102 [Sordaria brevicollis]
MLSKLRVFNTPGRFRLTKGCQLLPTKPLPSHSTRHEIFSAHKTLFSSKFPARRIHTATHSFEADQPCSEIGILNLVGREAVELSNTSTLSSEASHQAKGKQYRVSSAGIRGKEDQNGSIKQEERECPRRRQQLRDQLESQARQQAVDQMNLNQFGQQPGYPPTWQGRSGDQQEQHEQQQQQSQRQQYPNQQQWPQYGQYGMGYAPPPNLGGYGFAPPPFNAFAPGMSMSNWQQPPSQSSWGAGRQDYHTDNSFNNNFNNNSQYPQATDRYRPRSPIGYSRGDQGQYSDYNNYNSYNDSYNSRASHYRPRSPMGRDGRSPYRPRSPGGYSGGRRYNHNDAYAGSYRTDSYRPRSPGPYSSRGGQGQRGGYNNQHNNDRQYNTNSTMSNRNQQPQPQQHPLPPKPNVNASADPSTKPKKLNKKAKKREKAAREAAEAAAREAQQSQPENQGQTQPKTPNRAQAQGQAQQRPGGNKWPAPDSKGDIPRSASDPITPPSLESGGVPSPTFDYITRASLPTVTLSAPKPILVVIDLNGTLLHRPSRQRPTKFVERPFAKDFLKYCIDTFKVVIWSSARPQNVGFMCNQLLTKEQRTKVVAIWGRDRFGLTQADYDKRVQCYKRLKLLWADPAVKAAMPEGAEEKEWSQANTVLIDDSAEKARSEPYNCITLPEFVGDLKEKPQVLPMVQEYLNVLARQQDISAYVRVNPFSINVDSGKPVTGEVGVAIASPPAADQAEGPA